MYQKFSNLLLAGFPTPTANGLPGARPPGPRGPAFGARPVGPPAMGAPPMSAPPGGFTQQTPQAPGSGFAPPQQFIGRPGMAPPGTVVPMQMIGLEVKPLAYFGPHSTWAAAGTHSAQWLSAQWLSAVSVALQLVAYTASYTPYLLL